MTDIALPAPRAAGRPSSPPATARRRRWRRNVPEGIRPTKVGIWFVALTLLIGVAATNTGNNALYMVVALMLATLIVSGVLSRNDVRRVEVDVTPPEEVFAESPAAFQVSLVNHGRVLPRWLLLVSFSDHAPTLLCSSLPRGARRQGTVELAFPRRGMHRIAAAHLSTLFPLGLFRKGMRQQLDREVLVFPRLVPGRHLVRRSTSAIGETQDHRAGWGHDLHSLRTLRPGDDPRRIHWKQTARSGKLIFMERQAERSRRISVVLDNAVDPAHGAAGHERLELRISEAAAAALAYLQAGFEVELVTRSQRIDFGAGHRQRRHILETLALLESADAAEEPLAASAGLEVRFETVGMGTA